MLGAIATGIITKFRLQVESSYHAFYSSISGKLYKAGQVPDQTAMPYVTFFFPGLAPERKLAEAWDETVVQFTIFSSSTSAAEKNTIFANLLSWFDNAEKANGSWAKLAVSGYTVVSVDRGGVVDFPFDLAENENIITCDYSISLKE